MDFCIVLLLFNQLPCRSLNTLVFLKQVDQFTFVQPFFAQQQVNDLGAYFPSSNRMIL